MRCGSPGEVRSVVAMASRPLPFLGRFLPRLQAAARRPFLFPTAEACRAGGGRPVFGCVRGRTRSGARDIGGRIHERTRRQVRGDPLGSSAGRDRPRDGARRRDLRGALLPVGLDQPPTTRQPAEVGGPVSGRPASDDGRRPGEDLHASPPRRGGRHDGDERMPAGDVAPPTGILTGRTPIRRGLRSAAASPARRPRPGPGNTRMASPPLQAEPCRGDAGRRPHTGRSRTAPPPR